MSNNIKPVALYHATPVQNVPWILNSGLIPQLGPIAQKRGEKRKCVRLYTSAKRALAAVDDCGDYRQMAQEVWGQDVEIYVFRVFMNPGEAVALAEVKDNDAVELLCSVPSENLVLLNDTMDTVSEEKQRGIMDKYGPTVCHPPTTYKPLRGDLPF